MTAKDVSARCRRHVVALGLLAILAVAASEASAAPTVLEAENGTLTGNAHVSTAVSGYSGTGYVTGLQSANDTINWSFTGTPGLYDLVIRFRSPFGQKGFAGSINGHGFAGMFPSNSAFASFDAGLVGTKSTTLILILCRRQRYPLQCRPRWWIRKPPSPR